MSDSKSVKEIRSKLREGRLLGGILFDEDS